MKLSDKFANLGPSGLARQLAPKGGDAPAKAIRQPDKPPVVSPEPAAGAKPKFDRTAYQREYMRDYMRKRRAKPQNP